MQTAVKRAASCETARTGGTQYELVWLEPNVVHIKCDLETMYELLRLTAEQFERARIAR